MLPAVGSMAKHGIVTSCEWGISKAFHAEGMWPCGELCWHSQNMARKWRPKAPKALRGLCLGTMQGGVYNRMGADLDGIVLALRRPGMHLHWQYSVCFSSPLLGKAGEIKADASYIL